MGDSSSNSLLSKAAQHALFECLGYDEGRTYYSMLTHKEDKLVRDFSYSKKYRLLKNLFAQGAAGKCRQQKQDFFGYFIMPPSFLHKFGIEQSLIDALEIEYKNNHPVFLTAPFSQLILKEEKSLLVYLLKHEMHKHARLIVHASVAKCIPPAQHKKVTVYTSRSKTQHIGIIDNTLGFEFAAVHSPEGIEYVGYIAQASPEAPTAQRTHLTRIEAALKSTPKKA